ncbi:MAG TPA: adenylate/guanylate cyclase domain-containing protein [Gaiellaceae bacterium]|nr:adenylate/guanylate cyclase domain-containing protein [Gaiellaceae bacterium]
MSDGQLVHSSASAELVSFVPRLTLEWLRDEPDATWREVDGTLAFVDISGFTAMSERLSRLGRAGAEEITEVLNATFAALLAVAYAQGGGLLKFGGDALLLLYEGDEHAARAARAAFEMRRTLRAIGRPKTSAGPIQLKMHAGLHSGRFHFFLVGESHRELLVTGPAATRTVEMEAASEAGEILVSDATAALLGDDTLGEERERGRLLRAAPDVRGTVEPLPNIEGIALETAVPAPLRAQLLEVGPLEGEHRNAAVAFIHFAGIDEVIATEGPDAAAAALDGLVRTIQSAVEAHGVTFLESDIDRDGGKIILVAGAPQTFGDDEERMLRAMRAILDEGLPLPVHIGVSQGRVFAGQVGASFRRTYTVLGDTAALAARLTARAGEDEVWVSSEAFARGGRSFEAVELEPFLVKGKAEPVQAFVLGELIPETARADARSPEKLPFVDRERERAVLAASVAPVRMGFGTLVELVGEPGIGKSRLADELRDNCADMRQIGLRCEQYEASTPYYAFRPLLRSLLQVELNGGGEHNRTVISERLAAVDEELVPWTPLLAGPLDVDVESTPEVRDLDPAFWRARLHGVMGTLLGHLLDSPTLLVFDDVHWMDDASSELLRYLGTQLPTRPWLACTTRRPGDGGFAAAEGTPPLPALTLRLEPLPADDAKTLALAAAGGRRLTEDELAALMERGAGNPLFLQRLASVGEAADEAEDLPETVEALVATRIDQLAPGDRALLRWASVLGVSFSGSLIAQVLEGDTEVGAAAEAWDRLGEFVERDPDVAGAFRFRHALIRDAAYEGLSYRRRRELHGRVAEVIERQQGERTEEVAELLSLHYFNAGRWEKAWTYSQLAGDLARAVYANVDAGRFYERAIEVSSKVGDLAEVELARTWRALGEVRDAAGNYRGAIDALRSATTLLKDDPVEQAELYEERAFAWARLGSYSTALREITAGLKRIEPCTTLEAKHAANSLLARRAYIHLQQGRPRDTIAIASKVVADAEPLGPSVALARAYSALEGGYLFIGEPENAVYEEKALEMFRSLGAARSAAVMEMNLGVKAYAQGRWGEAARLYESARKEFERVGDVTQAAYAAANLGEVLVVRGSHDEADTLLSDARDTLRASEYVYAAVFCEIQLARLAIATGDLPTAVTDLTSLVEEARSIGDVGLAVEAWVHLSDAIIRSGEPDRALSELAEARRLLDDDSSPLGAPIARIAAIALMEQGDLERAGEQLSSAMEVAREQRLVYEEAQALFGLERLSRIEGREAEADAALHEAESLMQRVDAGLAAGDDA